MAAQAALSGQLKVGAGLTQRALAAPSGTSLRRLDLGPAPAASLGMDVGVRAERYLFGIGVSYRTSLAGRVIDIAAGQGADASETSVRSHQLDALARAGVSWVANTIELSAACGYSLSAFSSVAVLRIPRFTFHGPSARIELELPLSTAHVRLRLAPEAQWLPSISHALRDAAGINGSAFAVGAEVALQLSLTAALGLCLRYRESRAWARTRGPRGFSDLERYALLVATYLW